MDTKMSQKTRTEVLAKRRDRYAQAGKEHKTKIGPASIKRTEKRELLVSYF